MRSASPFITVKSCREAIDYYQGVLGGEIRVLNEHGGKLMHAELHVGGSKLHFADSMGRPVRDEGDNVRIILDLETEEEMTRIFEALSEEGTVTVELQDTFFGALHGQVVDKHKVGWVMNHFRS